MVIGSISKPNLFVAFQFGKPPVPLNGIFLPSPAKVAHLPVFGVRKIINLIQETLPGSFIRTALRKTSTMFAADNYRERKFDTEPGKPYPAQTDLRALDSVESGVELQIDSTFPHFRRLHSGDSTL